MLPLQFTVLGLQLQHHGNSGEVHTGADQLAYPLHPIYVIRAVPAGTPVRTSRLQQPAGLIQAQRLHTDTEQFRHRRNAENALALRQVADFPSDPLPVTTLFPAALNALWYADIIYTTGDTLQALIQREIG